ncbi:MAG: MBL fold metallo-hydrolase [Gemmataceae bacterium]
MAKSTKPAPGVTVRMYCQGLGDCFLLSFPPETGTRPVRVLIDCGVLQRTPAEAEKMRAVAKSLRDDTKDAKHPNGHIDLLVVTHEHWDHVAGFSHANDIFEKISFDHVWLSWAEDMSDPASKQVKKELGKKAKLQAALGAARMRLGARGLNAATDLLHDDLDATDGVLAFFGLSATAKPKNGDKLAAGKGRMSLGETMDWLRSKVKPGDYRVPGERRTIPGTAGVNAYVLGPPKEVAAIRKMNPTGDQGYRHLADQVSLLGAARLADRRDQDGQPSGHIRGPVCDHGIGGGSRPILQGVLRVRR